MERIQGDWFCRVRLYANYFVSGLLFFPHPGEVRWDLISTKQINKFFPTGTDPTLTLPGWGVDNCMDRTTPSPPYRWRGDTISGQIAKRQFKIKNFGPPLKERPNNFQLCVYPCPNRLCLLEPRIIASYLPVVNFYQSRTTMTPTYVRKAAICQ